MGNDSSEREPLFRESLSRRLQGRNFIHGWDGWMRTTRFPRNFRREEIWTYSISSESDRPAWLGCKTSRLSSEPKQPTFIVGALAYSLCIPRESCLSLPLFFFSIVAAFFPRALPDERASEREKEASIRCDADSSCLGIHSCSATRSSFRRIGGSLGCITRIRTFHFGRVSLAGKESNRHRRRRKPKSRVIIQQEHQRT